MTTVDYILSAGIVGALFLLGFVCVAAPSRVMWRDASVLSLGMGERTRRSLTQGLGLFVLLLSLWLAWRVFSAAA
jgi:hypothetical protein